MKIINIDRENDIVTFTLEKKMKLGDEISVELFNDLNNWKADYKCGVLKEENGKFILLEFDFFEKEDKTFSITKTAKEF